MANVQSTANGAPSIDYRLVERRITCAIECALPFAWDLWRAIGLSVSSLGPASKMLAPVMQSQDDVPWDRWYPMTVEPPHGEPLLLLARLADTKPGCEQPIIGHFLGDGWYTMIWRGDPIHKLIPLGWMPRPEFKHARQRLARKDSTACLS